MNLRIFSLWLSNTRLENISHTASCYYCENSLSIAKMSKREPPFAPQPLQVGAATSVPGKPGPAAASSAALASSSPLGAGPCPLFGSITPELLRRFAGASPGRRSVPVPWQPPAMPSSGPAALLQTAAHSRPAAGRPDELERACPEFLPPPPPLKLGDRPQSLASLSALPFPCRVEVSPEVPRLRSIIVAPTGSSGELRQRAAPNQEDGWQEVRPKFWWRKFNPSSSGEPRSGRRQGNSRPGFAPPTSRFNGICFRCLSPLHKVRDCRRETHCLLCRRPGHLARSCPVRARPRPAAGPPPLSQLLPPLAPPPPSQLSDALQANAAASPVLLPRGRPAMSSSPGHPSNRPDEVHSLSISSTAMERDASEMRRTHLGIMVSDPRLNISTRSVAKVLQGRLDFAWDDIHVSASFPNDFLVKFAHPWQRDMALEVGSLSLKHGTMALTTWNPTARGRPHTWRFYCQVAIENLPLNVWDDMPTIQAVLGGACELDTIERRSVLRDNTAALFAWVWCLDPDLIPRCTSHSILDRPATRREALPEGTPAEDGRDGPLFRIFIHLDRVIDYTPLSENQRRRGFLWPQDHRRIWEFGVKDGEAGGRRRPARDRLGPSNHRDGDRDDRRDDRDRDRDREGRRGDRRNGERRGDAGDDAEGRYRSDSGRNQQRHDRYERRTSRSPGRRHRGDASRHRSRSPRLERDGSCLRTTEPVFFDANASA
uniref:Uncharacterized protein n=1 Tax=Avena sativa TaxID=4498 RepID=A0ACD5YKB7_AVESA